ncbi:MAG: S-layer homology domain-containing protein [Clostridia bacterium]|nr:S-layer homology domain-containing protein [Clostridia bacterium]
MKIKRFLTTTVCTATLLTQSVCFASVTDDNPYNVALGKTVTDVNSVVAYAPNLPNLVNGDSMDSGATVALKSGSIDNAVIEINLGDTYTISGVDVVSGANAYGGTASSTDILKSYQIHYLSGDEWLPVSIAAGTDTTAAGGFAGQNITVGDDGYTVTCKYGYQFLTFAEDISTDKIRLVSKDVKGNVKILREIRVYKSDDDNVAYRKPVVISWSSFGSGSSSSTVQQVPSFIVDGQSNNANSQEFTFGSKAATSTTDHWIEIDLLRDYYINKAVLTTGGSAAFSLQAYADGDYADIPGASVTGNSSAECTLEFDACKTSKVRLFLPKGQSSHKIKEIKIYKCAPTTIELKNPEQYPLSVFKNEADVEAIITDSGYGVSEIKIYKNGDEIPGEDFEIVSDGADYSFKIKNLSSGENQIVIEVFDNEYTPVSLDFSITVYDEAAVLTDLKKCTTADALAERMAFYKSKNAIGIDAEDLDDASKWEYQYSKILEKLDDYTSLQQIADDFKLYTLDKKFNIIAASDADTIYSNINTQFPEFDWKDYDLLSDKDTTVTNILKGIKSVKDNLTDEVLADIEAKIADIVADCVGITYIKENTWGNVDNILGNYQKYFELENYDEYADLNVELRSKAAIYIIEHKSEFSNPKQLDDILEDAIDSATPSEDTPTVEKPSRKPSKSSSPKGSYTMPVTVPQVPEANPDTLYTDLAGYENQKEAVANMTARGIVNGVAEKTFAPGAPLTREQFVKMLVLTFDNLDASAEADFADTQKDAWYYPYVATGCQKGFIQGISDSEFGIGRNITREEMITLVFRVLEDTGVDFGTTTKIYADESNVSPWAVYAVKKMSGLNILKANANNELLPKQDATRIEAVKFLYDVLAIVEQGVRK